MLELTEDLGNRKFSTPDLNYALAIPTMGSGSPSTAAAEAFSPAAAPVGSGIAGLSTKFTPMQKAVPAPTKPGRDASGVITAESAAGTMGNDMQRPGGVFGTMDMAGVNGILERENKARGEMIDLSIKANGGNGVTSLPDYTAAENAEKTNRWALDDMVGRMKSAGTRTERAAFGQAMNAMISGQNQLDVEATRGQNQAAIEQGRTAIAARGQDLNFASSVAQQGLTARGQDLNAARDDQRIGIERSRLSLAETSQAQAGEKFALDKRIAEGQLADSDAVRAARTELSAALASGDPAKVAVAREKAIAAGVKLEKPNNEFTAVTNQMGGTTILNKDTGAGAIYSVEGKKVVDIAAPGVKPDATSQAADIKAQMQAGKITRDQALQQLKALGFN